MPAGKLLHRCTYIYCAPCPRQRKGEVRARKTWTLQYTAREAFLPPDEAQGRLRFPLPDGLLWAMPSPNAWTAFDCNGKVLEWALPSQ